MLYSEKDAEELNKAKEYISSYLNKIPYDLWICEKYPMDNLSLIFNNNEYDIVLDMLERKEEYLHVLVEIQSNKASDLRYDCSFRQSIIYMFSRKTPTEASSTIIINNHKLNKSSFKN